MAEVNVRIRNFYNQKPVDVTYYTTLEIYHSSIDVLRFVHDYSERQFTLENNAPRNAGETVTFNPLNFSALDPEQDDTPSARINITLGRVGSEVKEQLKKIRGFGYMEPAQIIYRRFLSDDTSAPVKVFRLFADQPIIKANEVTITATDDNPTRQNVSRLYTFRDFPGLEVI